jgi:hypothetical protein
MISLEGWFREVRGWCSRWKVGGWEGFLYRFGLRGYEAEFWSTRSTRLAELAPVVEWWREPKSMQPGDEGAA